MDLNYFKNFKMTAVIISTNQKIKKNYNNINYQI
jgi:hypothetical protein